MSVQADTAGADERERLADRVVHAKTREHVRWLESAG